VKVAREHLTEILPPAPLKAAGRGIDAKQLVAVAIPVASVDALRPDLERIQSLWNLRSGFWEMPYGAARALGLSERVVSVLEGQEYWPLLLPPPGISESLPKYGGTPTPALAHQPAPFPPSIP
jgi:hypothetical protein